MSHKTPVQLYKYLLKCTRQLPIEAQEYYKHHIRMGFKSHADENDAERIKQIIDRAIEDADWILKKYADKKK